MGNEHDRVRVVSEVVLEPIAGFEVEMVGGLVEKEKIRLRQKKLGERDAHLPAPAERLGGGVEFFCLEAEAEKNLFRPAFDAEATAPIPLVAALAVALENPLMRSTRAVNRAHLLFELAHLFAHGEKLFKCGERFRAKSFAAMGEPILRQIAHRRAARRRDFPAIWRFAAHEHAQERRLTRPVRASKADALAVGHIPRNVLEQNAAGVSFGQAMDLKHVTHKKKAPALTSREVPENIIA